MPNPPKPKASTLRAILTGVKSIISQSASPMALGNTMERAAGQFALNRMAENLDPYNYSTYNESGSAVSAERRAIDAILKNKKEVARSEQEQFIEKGFGKAPDPTFKERVDLLQMLANKPQKYNTISESQYRPSEGDEKGNRYYSSKGIEKEIAANLGLDKKPIMSEQDIMNIISEKATVDEKGKRKVGANKVSAIIPGLGEAKYGVGRDKKGLYLSYYDVWDLDPSQGAYADTKKSSPGFTLEGMKEALVGAGTQAVKRAASPANVYGRIYFDPKTGKPIR